ncbi:regulator of chromosome condensation (RCC1)-like protein [Rhizoctonia solani AG-3 Rhs1AP]|uniref:Regulator of chromosome condensation (RCC1)-like protein n=1 Tax=Rhizoctonia solani AG-3 Rhs1AP TaxID=1086054 RepID=X8J728_9AGAM|nr:regulator of chromosome condensation (RCC1)-like protein [Rhizoctonia solani AG-3 Rhs1AP]
MRRGPTRADSWLRPIWKISTSSVLVNSYLFLLQASFRVVLLAYWTLRAVPITHSCFSTVGPILSSGVVVTRATDSCFLSDQLVYFTTCHSILGAMVSTDTQLPGIAACWETSFVILTPPTTADTQCTLAKPDVVISFGANDFGDRGGPANAADGVTIIDFQSVCAPGIVAARVRGIATGPHHVVVLLEDKDKPISVVVGWGASRHGQLGTGNSTLATPPKSKSKRPTRPGPVQMIDKPTIIATYEDRPVNLAAGSQHTLILHQSGKITKLGSSRRGQLEIPDRIFTTPHIGCTWAASFVVSEGGQVEACGSSNHGQLGRGDNSSTEFGPVLLPGGVSQLACGSEHVLAVIGEEVWAWGWNEHGNLGVGHLEDTPVPVRVWPPVDDTIKGKVARIWAGCGTSWILAESNVVDEEKNS